MFPFIVKVYVFNFFNMFSLIFFVVILFSIYCSIVFILFHDRENVLIGMLFVIDIRLLLLSSPFATELYS